MKLSRRAKRMQRHHNRRNDKNTALNMVSLMDIFTILVFFLLVSAANTEVLPTPKKIELPESTASKAPKENLIVMVNNQDILVQGKRVSSVSSVMRSNTPIIRPLLVKLQEYQAIEEGRRKKAINDPKRGVTIMGDKEIPYALLKKIMLTTAQADFTNISLAVNQRAIEEPAS
jgi:biopolymer transport protein ExbD